MVKILVGLAWVTQLSSHGSSREVGVVDVDVVLVRMVNDSLD